MRTTLRATLILLAALLAGAALFVVFFEWNSLRGWVSAKVEAATGRKMTIETLEVQLGWRPTIRLTGVTLANPDWAEAENLIEADAITARMSLLPLLRGRIVVPYAELRAPVIALEKRGNARTWDLKKSDRKRPPPAIGQLVIENGTIDYLDPEQKTDLAIDVVTSAEVANELVVEAAGTVRGSKARGMARGPALLLLEDASAPYPLRAEFHIGGTSAKASGTVTGLAALRAVDLQIELAGPDLGKLADLAHAPLPSTPPYRLAGHLVKNGREWRIGQLQAKLGDSSASGEASFVQQERPLIKATLAFDLLDFDDLGPLIGVPPKTAPGETASAEQRRETRKMKAEKRSFPNKPIDTSGWRRMDAEFRFSSARVLHAPALPVTSVQANVDLKNGVLRVQPLELGVAGGTIRSSVELDGRASPLRAASETSFSGLQLPKLFPTVKQLRNAAGAMHGRAKLDMRGSSIAGLMGSADGRFSLAVNGGRISNLALELVGLDAGEALRIFATRDAEIPLRCAVADFDLDGGAARTRTLVLDTTDTIVFAEGVIDLGAEALDVTLYPQPKDKSVLALRAPLRVRGKFRDLNVRPDATLLAAKGLGAVLLGTLNPLLALAPLIETGPGKDSDCARLLADARTWEKNERSVASGTPGRKSKAAEKGRSQPG